MENKNDIYDICDRKKLSLLGRIRLLLAHERFEYITETITLLPNCS